MARFALLLSVWCFTACIGAESDPGLDAQLRVRGAQYVRGPLPEETNGPVIAALRVPHAQVLPGLRREVLSGSLPADASAVLVGLVGDRGHSIVTAGAPAVEEPDLPTFSAELSFAADTPVGVLTLELSAVRDDGAVGPRKDVTLDALARARSDFLSIELRWDTQTDLDLHVLLPDATELWPGNVNSYTPPPPGAAAPNPNAFRAGGKLDLDSNANCLLDGRRSERASWDTPPPAGLYLVRVAAASLCAENTAHWTLEVWRGATLLKVARGISQPWDTRSGSGLGAGVLALDFMVP